MADLKLQCKERSIPWMSLTGTGGLGCRVLWGLQHQQRLSKLHGQGKANKVGRLVCEAQLAHNTTVQSVAVGCYLELSTDYICNQSTSLFKRRGSAVKTEEGLDRHTPDCNYTSSKAAQGLASFSGHTALSAWPGNEAARGRAQRTIRMPKKCVIHTVPVTSTH